MPAASACTQVAPTHTATAAGSRQQWQGRAAGWRSRQSGTSCAAARQAGPARIPNRWAAGRAMRGAGGSAPAARLACWPAGAPARPLFPPLPQPTSPCAAAHRNVRLRGPAPPDAGWMARCGRGQEGTALRLSGSTGGSKPVAPAQRSCPPTCSSWAHGSLPSWPAAPAPVPPTAVEGGAGAACRGRRPRFRKCPSGQRAAARACALPLRAPPQLGSHMMLPAAANSSAATRLCTCAAGGLGRWQALPLCPRLHTSLPSTGPTAALRHCAGPPTCWVRSSKQRERQHRERARQAWACSGGGWAAERRQCWAGAAANVHGPQACMQQPPWRTCAPCQACKRPHCRNPQRYRGAGCRRQASPKPRADASACAQQHGWGCLLLPAAESKKQRMQSMQVPAADVGCAPGSRAACGCQRGRMPRQLLPEGSGGGRREVSSQVPVWAGTTAPAAAAGGRQLQLWLQPSCRATRAGIRSATATPGG